MFGAMPPLTPVCPRNQNGCSMASITLKDIPAPLHRALKRRAALHHRSLNQEAIAILTDAAGPTGTIDVEAMIARERRIRSSLGFKGDIEDLLKHKRDGLL